MRLSVADARDLAEGALRGIGYTDDEARIVADHVVDAALCGYEYSGLAKILNLPESEHFRLPRRPMSVLRETDVSLAFDGGNNVGMLVLHHAARATIEKATAHGIALVSVTDAWMSGRSAYYVEMIAKAGLVAIHTAASSRLVAPPGGIRPMLGTNPIAIAVPSSRGPIVLDMGTSAFMMTEVLLRERLGEPLPEGVALGPDGAPTRDPASGPTRRAAAVRRLQGLRPGADDAGAGAPGRLRLGRRKRLRLPFRCLPSRPPRPGRCLRAASDAAHRAHQGDAAAPGVDEIRIPSERAFRSRDRALREGLEIDRLVFDALVALRTRSR